MTVVYEYAEKTHVLHRMRYTKINTAGTITNRAELDTWEKTQLDKY